MCSSRGFINARIYRDYFTLPIVHAYSGAPPANDLKLRDALKEEWKRLDPAAIEHLIESLPKGCHACIQAREGHMSMLTKCVSNVSHNVSPYSKCDYGRVNTNRLLRGFDMPKRKYDPVYIKYGFIAIEHGGEAPPQCVVCMKSLSYVAMKSSLFKRHLETDHADKKDQDQSYFQRLGENVKRQRMDKTGQIYQKGAGIVKASYEVALLVAKNMKPHAIAESLIMPAAKILVSHVIGEEAVAKLESVSVSNNTAQHHIEEMLVDIADQVVEGGKSSEYGFAIQLDESTDVTNCSQLLAYVRFTQSNAAKTELLLSQDLSSTTTGKDIFNVLDNFFNQNELDWGKLVGCTIDGAPSMLGRKSGFQDHVKAVAPNATAVHCFIHIFALCAKVLPPKLLSCLNRVFRIVNFVKTSDLNTRVFKLLCEDFGSDHICLLYHTEVRWLSLGNTTRRLFELRDVLLVFFKKKEHDFQKDLEDEEFISRLAYLSDIFGALNHLNLSFQGPDCSVTEFISKLGAFVRKLDLWMKNVESKGYGMFELLTPLEREPTDEFAQEIVHYLSLLKTELKHYFPDVTCCAYVANLFSVNPADLPIGTGEQEELIDIQADETVTRTRRTISSGVAHPLSTVCKGHYTRRSTLSAKAITLGEAHCLQRPLHSVKRTAWVAISKHGIIGPFWFEDDNERSVAMNTERYVLVLGKFWTALGRSSTERSPASCTYPDGSSAVQSNEFSNV
ncbi:zinc finger BED domain-containing protein 5-like [Palaemon carinicauda]|uniref:zinc finger BED domain-containing protein 5-like n=1 Tax=Palaemon carinicauda TaxID=392227 RepID=UPI0035B69806